MLFALLCLVPFIQISVLSKNQLVETFIRPQGQTNTQTCPFKKKWKVILSIRYFVPRDPHCDSVSRRALGVQSGDSEGLLVTLFPALIAAHTMRSAKKKKKKKMRQSECWRQEKVQLSVMVMRLWGSLRALTGWEVQQPPHWLQWVFPTAPLLQ